MPIWGHDLEKIELSHLQELVNVKERENLYLEYKRQLHRFDIEKDKIEFLYDLTAFANSNGGDIIYGIKEKYDNKNIPTSIPESIVGLDSSINFDNLQQNIIAFAMTKVEPPLIGLQFRWLDYNDKKILIVRIPRSWAKPHSVKNNDDIRVYIRTESGKAPLQYREIKQMIIESSTMIDKIKNFRNERLEQLKQNELYIYGAPSITVIHMIPLMSFESGNIYNVQFLKNEINSNSCLPLGNIGIDKYRYNFDGYVEIGELNNKPACYLLVFRNGILESANNRFIENHNGHYSFPAEELEKHILYAFKQYMDFYKCIKQPLPIIACISIMGTKDVHLRSWQNSVSNYLSPSQPIDRQELLLPEIIVENYDIKPTDVLRPIFDAIWNAADMPRSMSYNEDGSYKFDYS